MTRQYFSHHKNHEGLMTSNSHIAGLIINSFIQPEIPVYLHPPYQQWKRWLAEKQMDDNQPKG